MSDGRVFPVSASSAELNTGSFRDQVTVYLIVGTAFLLLLIGLPLGDARLQISGVVVAPLVSLVALFMIACVRDIRYAFIQSILFLVPVAICGVTLFWSDRPDYGTFKYLNLIGTCLLAIPLLLTCAKVTSQTDLAKVWIVLMTVLLLVTLAYKARYGFFDRQVLFFMNGPIVFGRLMGVAAVLSLVVFTGLLGQVAFFVFSAAVIWTMSKGPLLAIVIATAFVAIWVLDGKARRQLFTTIAVLAILGSVFAWELIASVNWGRLTALLNLFGSGIDRGSSEFGSIGARVLMFQQTLELIPKNILGVGLGGWSHAVSENFGLNYPHNLFLELWSECGFLLGSIALVPFLSFVSRLGSSVFSAAAVFLLAAQMVSGDLLDARYLLVFSALSVPASGLLSTSAPPIITNA